MMRRPIIWLFAAACFILILPLSAQLDPDCETGHELISCRLVDSTFVVESGDALPGTAPPGLLLLILLDDGGSMERSGGNSADTGQPPRVTGRPVSDPTRIRWQEVQRVIDTLHADQVARHQVAVLSFDRTTRRWLTGRPDDPFMVLGLGAGDSGYIDFKNRLATHTAGTFASDTVLALDEGVAALTSKLRLSGESLKPAILMITDDVPIGDYATGSPWSRAASAAGIWNDYLQGYRTTIANLTVQRDYEGYCQSNGIPMSVIAMTTANWVDIDGTIVESGNGQFFQSIAIGAEWFNIDNTPLVYTVDPTFTDNNLTTFFDRTNQALADLRCLDIFPPDGLDAQTGAATIDVSTLYNQLRVIADPPSGVEITVRDASGRVLTEEISGVKRYTSGLDGGNIVWTFDRNAFTVSQWSGTWLFIPDAGSVGNLSYQREVNLSEISWSIVNPRTDYNTNSTIEAEFQLQVGNIPISDREIIESVDVLLDGQISVGTDRISFTDGVYKVTLNDSIETANNYRLTLQLFSNQRFIKGLPFIPILRLNQPQIITIGGNELGLAVVQPSIRRWCQDKGEETVSVIISGIDDTLPGETDSLYSYSVVQLFYEPPPDPFATNTPIGTPVSTSTPQRLQWNINGDTNTFIGQLDCELLVRGQEQSIEIVAFLPNATPLATMQVFDFEPTITPTLAATLTPTVTPTALPTPTWPDPFTTAAGTVGENRTLQLTGLVGLGLLGFALVIGGTRVYFRSFLPLYFVFIQHGESGNRRPLLSVLGRYFPIQRKTIRGEKRKGERRRDVLFTVTAAPNNSLRIRAGSRNILVNNKTVASQNRTESSRGTTVIRIGNDIFFLTNRRPSRT